jgi:DNA replication protein DnaC
MSMEAISLTDYCKQLRLKTIVEIYEDVVSETKEQYLTELFRQEVESRYNARVKRLMKKAGFLTTKTLEGYMYDHITWPKPSSKSEILDLAFLENHENVLMLGAVGTGKTQPRKCMSRNYSFYWRVRNHHRSAASAVWTNPTFGSYH